VESFQLPVSIIIALITCTTTFAITISKPKIWLEPTLASNGPDPALTTQCERLVRRYLRSDHPRFEDLVSRVRRYVGDHAYELMLAAVDDALHQESDLRRDRLYTLKGEILDRLGRRHEAISDFQAALLWNPDNVPARRQLIRIYLENKSIGQARIEIDKAIAHDPEGAAYYEKLLAAL